MSMTTIQIPADHVAAVRESLLATRRELEPDPMLSSQGSGKPSQITVAREASGRVEEIDRLLEQLELGEGRAGEDRQLTGSRAALWDAVYDSVCSACERLAEECNEYWRGGVDPSETRSLIADVDVRFGMLESLGPPPRAARRR